MSENKNGRLGAFRSFLIAGIGASAGGLEAFKSLLRVIPKDANMALVLVQHIAPLYHSVLADILSRSCDLPVTQAKAGERARPGCVYVIPPGRYLFIRRGIFRLAERTEGWMTIDRFFDSLAKDRRDRAAGVVLSGTGRDGSCGLRSIKARGGVTFAQEARSAGFSDMPANAAAGGFVDFVLPPDRIGEALVRLSRGRGLALSRFYAGRSGAVRQSRSRRAREAPAV